MSRVKFLTPNVSANSARVSYYYNDDNAFINHRDPWRFDTVSSLIKKNADFVLDTNDWSFEVRHDGTYNIDASVLTNGIENLKYLDGIQDTDFRDNAVVDGTTPRIDDSVLSIAIQSDGKILVGGIFQDYDGQTGVNKLIRLNADGTLDTNFVDNATVDGTTSRFGGLFNNVQSIAIQSDGKILVGGIFTNYDGQTGVDKLIRLNADGTLDTAFRDNAVVDGTTPRFNSTINTITIQSDGKILVGGTFTNYDGQTGVDKLIRLNADGTLDTDFRDNAVVNGTTPRFSGVNSTIFSIVIQSDGKILVGGIFFNYDGQTGVSRLIRLNADGTLDTAFRDNAVVNGTTPRFSSTVASIAIQSDGKILVGGIFTNYDGQTGVDKLIRLNADGTLDTDFRDNAVVDGTTPRFSTNARTIAIQSDGKILVGGASTNYDGQTGVDRLIRLNADGTLDTAFVDNAVVDGTTPRFSSNISTIAIQSDGNILVGGQFQNYDGQTGVNRLIRFNTKIEANFQLQVDKGSGFETVDVCAPSPEGMRNISASFEIDLKKGDKFIIINNMCSFTQTASISNSIKIMRQQDYSTREALGFAQATEDRFGLSKFPILEDQLQDGSVTTDKLADNAVTTDKLADNAVITDKILDSTITVNKLADADAQTVLARDSSSPGTPNFLTISENSVLARGTGNLTSLSSGNNGVLRRSGSGALSFGTIVAGNIANNAVTTAKIENGAVTTAKLDDTIDIENFSAGGGNFLIVPVTGQMRSVPTYNSTTPVASNVVISSFGFFSRSTSSIKYKKDIETIDLSYSESLLESRPVWYRSKCDSDKSDWGHWGFIAEELAEIDPRLVHWEEKEDGTLEAEGVQYDRFVPHLINIAKDQKKKIEELEKRIKNLENK